MISHYIHTVKTLGDIGRFDFSTHGTHCATITAEFISISLQVMLLVQSVGSKIMGVIINIFCIKRWKMLKCWDKTYKWNMHARCFERLNTV